MKLIAVTLVVLLSVLSSALAEQKPLSLATDQRVKVVPYNEDNVVSIKGTTFVSTQIVFGNDEAISDVQAGDATSWTVFVNKDIQNILNIKPTTAHSNTDLTVITVDHQGKRRRYYFHLLSFVNRQGAPITYALKFIYPLKEKYRMEHALNSAKQQKQAIVNSSRHPSAYNWDYSFSGSEIIVPAHVFDDGRFTYFKLRPNQLVPAIFAVDDASGDESVVNYRREGDYLVVMRVAPQFTLREGNAIVASIFNKKLIGRYEERI